jgi:serine protease Do
VARTSPQTEVEVKVIRDGQPETLQVTLGELNFDQMLRSSRPGSSSRQGDEQLPTPTELIPGVELIELNPRMRRQYNLPSDLEGSVLVTQVEPGSPAYEEGLRPGAIVLDANQQPVSSLARLQEIIQGSNRERLVLRVRHPNGVVSFLVLPMR